MRKPYKEWTESRLYKRDTIIGYNAGVPGRVLCIYKMRKSTHRLRKILRWAKYNQVKMRGPFKMAYADYWECKHMHGHPYYYYNSIAITPVEPANKAQFHFKAAAATTKLFAAAKYIAGPGLLHAAWQIYNRMLVFATKKRSHE